MKLDFVANLLILVHQILLGVRCEKNSSNYELLLKKLLSNTSPLVRPVHDRKKSLNVTVGLELIQINRLDESGQTLSCKFWSRVTWKNEFMKWNRSEWQNINFTQISAYKIWTPDIVLYNNAANNIGGGLELPNSRVTMYPDGRHMWLFPVTYESSCKINVLYFPFDGQKCKLKLGSWTFNNKYIALKLDDNPLITHHYIHSTEWNLIQLNKSMHSVVYDGYGPIPYDDVTFSIKISRVSLGYIFYMIAPCLLLIMTTLFSFSLPPESGERITVIVTNLLAFAFFMNVTNEILPTNSDTITVITVFYLVLVIESAGSLLMAVCVLTVFHRGEEYNPPEVPKWMKYYFYKVYVKIYRMESITFSAGIAQTASQAALAALRIDFMEDGKPETKLDGIVARKRKISNQRPLSMSELPSAVHRILPTIIDSEVALKSIHSELEYVKEVNDFYEKRDKMKHDWKIVGVMLDRLYFWIFLLSVTFSSLYMLLASYLESLKFSENAMFVPEHSHS